MMRHECSKLANRLVVVDDDETRWRERESKQLRSTKTN